MIDIKFIRQHTQIVKDGAFKKNVTVDIDKLLEVDEQKLGLLKEIEILRSEQNTKSDLIMDIQDLEAKRKAVLEVKIIKENIKEKEMEYKKVSDLWQKLMYEVPNIPDVDVPVGASDKDNVPFKSWGEKKEVNFEQKGHVDLMQELGLVDLERGVKVHGFRGYFLKGDGVRLCFAIWQYALEFFSDKGFNPMIAPAIARKENFYGTGHLPNDAQDTYVTQDNDYLCGTAEVSIMGYHQNEVLDSSAFPIKYLGFSPCYRREAGSHGKDTKGLIRVHEFFKWEQVVMCEASHQESVRLHEEINRNTEEFIESLNIPYQTVLNCGGDLGQGQVKKYDIELWVPNENKYREISSASYFHDYQSRRLNIRYKDNDGILKFVHSLNCTAIPTPRILVSLMENFQQSDGSITIPEPLQKYMQGEKVISKEK